MPLAGNLQRLNRGAGVYPGSGVSRGGQQARSGTVHNGAGGARQGGGARLGGSLARAGTLSGSLTRATPGKPNKPKPTPGKPRVTPALAPAPVRPAIPTPPDFTLWQDSQYLDEVRGVRNQYESELNPVNSEIESLQTKGLSGKTMYDSLYGRAQDDFGQSVFQARDDASKRGLLVSGAHNRTRTGLADDWITKQQGLSDQYGANRIAKLVASRQRMQLAQQQQMADLQRSSSARGQEWWRGRYDSQFDERLQGIPQDPTFGFGGQ